MENWNRAASRFHYIILFCGFFFALIIHQMWYVIDIYLECLGSSRHLPFSQPTKVHLLNQVKNSFSSSALQESAREPTLRCSARIFNSTTCQQVTKSGRSWKALYPVISMPNWSIPSDPSSSQVDSSVMRSSSKSLNKKSKNQNQPKESSWMDSPEPKVNLTSTWRLSLQSTESSISLSRTISFWKNLWAAGLVSTAEPASTSAISKGKSQ